MAADFFFADPTFQIPAMLPLAAFKWQHLGNAEVQNAIAAEEQYLAFHIYMLGNLRHTRAGQVHLRPYSHEIGLSVRAGAIKAAILLAASIAEAALRTLAEFRGYRLNENPARRTFGNVIKAWEVNGVPLADVAPIWEHIKAMHTTRNFVHLHVAAGAEDADWGRVLERENELLHGAIAAINHIATIRP